MRPSLSLLNGPFRISLPVGILLLAACAGDNANPGNGDGGAGSDGGSIPAGVEIAVAQGMVRGIEDGKSRVFLGIPYAAPPTGEDRFRAPRPPASWNEIREADRFGPGCPQIVTQSGKYDDKSKEDCLTLNIWTPRAPASLRPVMLWFHGGGFILGSGSEGVYDGRILSERGEVVVVTVNYRLGPLGFLAHPALDAEDPQRPTSGNYGLEDQRQALRWIRDNVARFGGDPNNVTIFGESAGASSVCYHLVSPESQGLFHRGIVESGGCFLNSTATRQTNEVQGAALVDKVGCDPNADAATIRSCLRGLTPQQIITALPLRPGFVFGDGVNWGPCVDGVNLPAQPAEMMRTGKGANVPLIVGSNKDEGTIFFVLGGSVADEQALRAALAVLFPPLQLEAVLARYNPSKFSSAQAAATQIVGDIFVCAARRTARLASAAGNPTFVYHFTREFRWIFPDLGAFHSAELPFVFGNPYVFISLKPDELPLSDAMQGYWSRFAATGDPNGASAFVWPAYSTASDEHIELDLVIGKGSALRKEACDFWDDL